MEISKESPGPKIGHTLHALLEDVLDDPTLNTTEYLEKKAMKLIKLSIDKLKKLGDKGKDRREKVDEEEVKKLRDKHWVK